MMNKLRSFFLLISISFVVASADLDLNIEWIEEVLNLNQLSNYSEHPVVQRMQCIENLLGNDDISTDVAVLIRHELNLYSPWQNPEVYLSPDESIVALLKLLAILHNRFPLDFSIKGYPFFAYGEFWTSFSNITKELVADRFISASDWFQERPTFFEQVLDWYTCVKLLDALSGYDYPPNRDIEWISYAFMLVIENSSHLKSSFSKSMLFKLNHIRNKANAIHLIQQIKLNNVKRTVNRFPFQNIIVNLGLANRNETSVEVFLPQMKLNLIDKTLRFALSQRAIAARSKHEYGDAFIFSALLELDNNELVLHVDDIAFALEIFEFSVQNPVISTLQTMLRDKCSDQIFLLVGLPERLNEFDSLRMNSGLLNDITTLKPQFLEQCAIVFKMVSKHQYVDIAQNIIRIYYKSANMLINSPEFFDPKLLADIDRQQIAIYEADEMAFLATPNWFTNSEINEFLFIYSTKAEELFQFLIYNSNPDPSFINLIRNQIRILLRYATQLANLRRKFNMKIMQAKLSVEKIATTYINLMMLGADVFTTDPVLMKNWYQFTLNFAPIITKILDTNMINELAQLPLELNEHGESASVFYIYLTRIANFLASNNCITSARQLFEKILILEKKIGYSDTAPLFIQKQVMREKQIFYIFFSQQTVAYVTRSLDFDYGNLEYFIEHQVEMLTSLIHWDKAKYPKQANFDVQDVARYHLLYSIYLTVVKTPMAELMLSNLPGLRYRVNQLTSGFKKDFGLEPELAEQINRCTHIFGLID